MSRNHGFFKHSSNPIACSAYCGCLSHASALGQFPRTIASGKSLISFWASVSSGPSRSTVSISKTASSPSKCLQMGIVGNGRLAFFVTVVLVEIAKSSTCPLLRLLTPHRPRRLISRSSHVWIPSASFLALIQLSSQPSQSASTVTSTNNVRSENRNHRRVCLGAGSWTILGRGRG